jgi:hypothetical protein
MGGGGGDGKNPLATVLSIALVVAAPYAGAALASSFGFAATTAAGAASFATIAFTGAVNAVGGLLINALAPPATPKINSIQSGTASADVSQTYFIQGARNSLTPFGTVPEVLGTHRIVPPLAVQTYTEVSGDIVYSRQMFALSNGKLSVSNERLGETSLDDYTGVSEENFFDGNSTDDSNLIPSIVTQNDLNVTLDLGGAFVSRTTAANIDEFEVDISFPQGLVTFDTEPNQSGAASGDKRTASVTFTIEYAPTGTGSWTSVNKTVTRTLAASFVNSYRFTVPRGQYDVRIKKISSTGEDTTDTTRDDASWIVLRSITNENPVNVDGVSLKALRIQGTDQLNGAVDDYNCDASRKIPDWSGSSWVADQITSNPASIYRFVLLSDTAKTPISSTRVDDSAIQDWHTFCANKGLTYDSYIDYDADRESLLREIAAAGLATPAIVDNKYSVVVDNEKSDIIQHISQRNSFNYSYEKNFATQPHAFRIPFLNKDADYLRDEIIVYDDGYDATNATELEQIDFPGVVTAENNYKLGRHRMAEIRLRPDAHRVTMDIENIVATRGDRVKFSHDVALIGLKTGRVKSVTTSGSDITSITVDEQIQMESDKSYSMEFWLSTGESLTVAVNTVAGNTYSLTFSTPVPTSTGLDAGDLFSFGETNSVTIDALVHSITPQEDFLAEIKLIDYAPGVFTAADGTIPTYNNNITTPIEFTRPKAPELVAIQSDEFVQIRNIDNSISSRMVITLKNNNLFGVSTNVLIREIGDDEYAPANTVQKDPERVVIEGLQQGAVYDIRIFYRRLGGAELSSNSLSDFLDINGETFIGEGSPPPDVTGLEITVRGENVRLSWLPVNVIDLDHYEVRFTQQTSGATWANGLALDNTIPANVSSINVPSGIGTYMIKAVDRQGNYSESPALAVTTVGKLLNLNVVQTITEAPTWAGTNNNTVVDGGELKLGGSDNIDDWALVDDIGLWDYGDAGVAETGTYTFATSVDLGAVYDNVLSAALSVFGEGVFDEVDSWGLVDDRDNWDGVSPDQYIVEIQVRTTNDDPSGSPTWSEWTPLRPLGEYTARGFEFRLFLARLVDDVTPVVSAVSVTVDMPDRLEDSNGISSGTGGKSVLFNEAFRAAPTVEITVNDLDTGDYMVGPTNVTATGFDIEFFNSVGTSVDRTFSYVAKGYGRVS